MTTPIPPDESTALLDVKALAVKLSISQGHIYRLATEKRIPFLRIGTLLRFDPAVIDAWLDNRKVEQVR